MLQGEHSAILSTFIKQSFVIKIVVLSIFEWPFYTGFTVLKRMISLRPLFCAPKTYVKIYGEDINFFRLSRPMVGGGL